MQKYKVGETVELPSYIKFDLLSRAALIVLKCGRIIMNKFKVGSQVELPKEMHPGVPGTVIMVDEKKEKYLVRFNGVQQQYFTEDQLKIWDK